MRVALIAMPWNAQRLPSPALGALGAYLRERTEHSVSCLHEYVEVALSLGALYEPLSASDRMGELIYAAHLFSRGEAAIASRHARWLGEYDHGIPWCWSEPYPWPPGDPDGHLSRVFEVTGAHIDAVVGRVAGKYDVAGFTTTAGQLFASLAVARRLKQLRPETRVILGGEAVGGETGATLLSAFPFIDHVVEGEGEEQLVALLDRIGPGGGAAVRTTGEATGSLDELPIPDLREYRALDEQHDLIKWSAPIEGSRPDRGGGRRRVKSCARIALEIGAQCERHENVSFLFVDGDGLGERGRTLGGAIKDLGKQISFFHHLDTAIHPYDLLCLWEAGCAAVHMSVDGLSTAYLRRIGRTTTAIQSLQAMRTCYELGLNNNHSTLLTDHPGSTDAEVAETADAIRRFAIAYQPLETRRFRVTPGSAVARDPASFGVANIRNADEFADVVPAHLLRSLKLRWLDHDVQAQADWSVVRAQTEPWRDLHRRLLRVDGVGWFLGARSLYYHDGGTFLRITDRRGRGGPRDFTLDALMRRVYLDCMEIMTRQELRRRLADRCEARELDEVIAELEVEDLVFTEGDGVLSLAVAPRADLAAKRIRHARFGDASRRPAPGESGEEG